MKAFIFSLALLIGSISSAQLDPGTEVLMGAMIYSKTIKIQVRSGGCTWKESFTVKKSFNLRQNTVDIAFVRIFPDYCEAYLPEGRVISFSMNELKMRSGQKFNIVNSFSAH